MQPPALAYRLLRWRSHVRGWLAALMLFLLALAAQVELGGVAADRPFLFFVPAIIAATALGGWMAGAALTCGAAVAVVLLFLDPAGTPGFLPEAVSLAFFLVLSAAGIALLEALIRYAARLEAERDRGVRLVEEHRTLLSELQHRTANHMQFVSAVLALQARRVSDGEGARTVLREAGQRLDTLARVHRRLCQPESAGGNLARFVQEISQDLLTAAGAENTVCVVDVAPVQLEPERLTTLALIITELLTNALKHAFADGRGGTIAITLRETVAGRYALEVRDDGVGIDAAAEQAERADGSGLGTRILRSLADRLEGSLSIRAEGGTVARLEFPVPSPA